MGCAFCGGGDRWIKTCLAADGSRLRVCDQCWEALRLVIVPGDASVTARCDLCGVYGNPRDFPLVRPGGRKNAFSGTCGACADDSAKEPTKDAARTENHPEGGETMKKTHDYVHHYRGYWSEGGKCRIRIYQGKGGLRW